jgi:Uma2 family endonuclease
MSTMVKPPRTLLEVFQSLPEGTLAQLIQNELVRSPAPSFYHQQILSDIQHELTSFVKKKKLGIVVASPVDVWLNNKNIYQPDLIFITNGQNHLIKNNGFHGAPDLVVEILSPSTAKYDLEEKKDVYEQFGVKEYIIVNPADKSVTVYDLTNGVFTVSFSGTSKVESKLLGTKFEF